jgi:hypothetical protein
MTRLLILAALVASAGAAWGQASLDDAPQCKVVNGQVMLDPAPCWYPDGLFFSQLPQMRATTCTEGDVSWPSRGGECFEADKPRRTYTLSDIDRMRAAVRKQVPCGNYCDSSWQWRLTIEGMTQTYIAAGISPEALERKTESKP